MTMAIGHSEDDVVMLDALRERRPPFSPEDVVAEFAALLKSYRIDTVTGDRYAGEWPRERFAVHGIEYQAAAKPKRTCTATCCRPSTAAGSICSTATAWLRSSAVLSAAPRAAAATASTTPPARTTTSPTRWPAWCR